MVFKNTSIKRYVQQIGDHARGAKKDKTRSANTMENNNRQRAAETGSPSPFAGLGNLMGGLMGGGGGSGGLGDIMGAMGGMMGGGV